MIMADIFNKARGKCPYSEKRRRLSGSSAACERETLCRFSELVCPRIIELFRSDSRSVTTDDSPLADQDSVWYRGRDLSVSAAGLALESNGLDNRATLGGSRRDSSLVAHAIDDRGNIHFPPAVARRPGTPRIVGRIPPDPTSPLTTCC